MNKIYSPQVIEYTQKVINSLSERDEELGGNFFEIETPRNPELGKQILYELIADTATENFLQREDQEIILSEDQMIDAFSNTVLHVSLDHLQKEGLINFFEDENGEECFFLTEAGKQVTEEITKRIQNGEQLFSN
jgi:hypothetical protein